MADVCYDVLLVCLVAVYLKAELGKACLRQLAVDHVQGCQLLGNEEDLFAVIEAFGNNVGNRLALAGPGRALQDKAFARLCHLYGLNLAGIRINHVVQLNEGIGDRGCSTRSGSVSLSRLP